MNSSGKPEKWFSRIFRPSDDNELNMCREIKKHEITGVKMGHFTEIQVYLASERKMRKEHYKELNKN